MVRERKDLDIVQQGTEEEIFDVIDSITESRRKRNNIEKQKQFREKSQLKGNVFI